MDDPEHYAVYRNEQTHFYYLDIRDMVTEELRTYRGRNQKKFKILDAGCGTGGLSMRLRSFGEVQGVDISPLAVRLSRTRGLRARLASIESLPFRSSAFDVVVSIDVLYHGGVSSDSAALSEFNRVLRPGGVLILRVPGVPWFYRRHDVMVHTKRRYSAGLVRRLLERSGFCIRHVKNIHLIPFVIAYAGNIISHINPSKRDTSDVHPLPDAVNWFLYILLHMERCISKFIWFPIGLGIFAVAYKPKDKLK